MKNLKNLRGVKELNTSEQKNTFGGFPITATSDCRLNGCPSNEVCTQFWEDNTGPFSDQTSYWTCIDPMNYK